jgi:preprotein translocase subunit SecE
MKREVYIPPSQQSLFDVIGMVLTYVLLAGFIVALVDLLIKLHKE